MKKQPEHAFARPYLEEFAAHLLRHTADGSINPAPSVERLSAVRYRDPAHFQAELERLFRRMPLMLIAGCELGPNQYKAMEVAGVPVLVLRGGDGAVRAYLNICPHRGAILADGQGTRTRFTCPYHGWTFLQDGQLAAYPLPSEFGEVGDARLVALPSFERAGMIWVTLSPKELVSPDALLSGLDRLLDVFDLGSWHLITRKELTGPNWKLCFDAHLDFYHLPVLHKNSFGTRTSPKAVYGYWGPHQRLVQPKDSKEGVPEAHNVFQLGLEARGQWPLEAMMLGEWILFPNVSINIFYKGGLGMLISQVLPGRQVGESVTVQSYYLREAPDDASLSQAQQQSEFLAEVVGEEDLPTSDGQQLAIASGYLDEFILGRNEGGMQAFHLWLDRIVDTDDDDLEALLSTGPGWRYTP